MVSAYNRHQFGRVGELEAPGRGVDIHTDELLTLLDVDRDHCLQKVDKAFGMVSLCKVEIDSVVNLLDVDGILVRTVLQNRLLQVQESPLVGNLLSHLHAGSPGVVGITLCTIRALVVVLCVFYLEALLHDGAIAEV